MQFKTIFSTMMAAGLTVACNSNFRPVSIATDLPDTSPGNRTTATTTPTPTPATGPVLVSTPSSTPVSTPSSTPSPTPSLSPLPQAGGPGCGLTSAAFCDTFDQGPTAAPGRSGDLDATKWSLARLSPDGFSGIGPVANPVRAAPIPTCRSSLGMTSVFPPFDTLICDPDSRGNRQLMTAVAVQNYGNNSYMIQQPFDFANRTGKITFDVDAANDGGLGAYIAVDITEDPLPAPTFQEFHNYEAGPIPRNGVMIKFNDQCGQGQNAMRAGNLLTYDNFIMTMVTPTFTIDSARCPKTKRGLLNHFEIQLSQSRIDIYASDYSPDGVQVPNLKLIYSANISVPFSRGYIHMAARNHATEKYGFGPVGVFHWDNIGFDGPILLGQRFYSVKDNSTRGDYLGTPIMNLGYMLRDTNGGNPAGIYDPIKYIGPLQMTNVNVQGATSAKLSFNGFFLTVIDRATTSWGWKYRLNGGTWVTRTLTPLEVALVNGDLNIDSGTAGMILMIVDVPIADVKNGTNTLEILPVNAPMNYPPVVSNIDLILR